MEDYKAINEKEILGYIEILKSSYQKYRNIDNLKTIFNLQDLTTLSITDNVQNVTEMCKKVNEFEAKFGFNNVAAICVYPLIVEIVKESLKAKNVNIASVSAGFPASQTFMSIKIAETELAVNKGADEIDIVLSLGKFNNKEFEYCATEISIIKNTIGNKHLKVILESGEMNNLQDVYTASVLSMESGADFIKTSTGKSNISATPEAVYTMCLAIKDYHAKTGKKVGLKPSGGISTTDDALMYFAIVKEVLGDEWLNNKLFRLGVSRLANNLLKDILEIENKTFEKYF